MTITIETLPAVKCTPWCEQGDGHTGELFPEDQWCCGPLRIVKLTRMPMRFYYDTSSDGSEVREQWLDNIQTYLCRDREGSPYLHLGRDGRDPESVKMALSEVAELRDNLTAALVEAGIEVKA